ncbi:MAG: hypothetical protein A2913_00820 [Parcubacteria group bacterium RIFCSPLOWO2_01_FULL_40_65]|nr:MAG: hypothetical protein A2734_02540 [Parcubacteria group bacterium RIFCSPHIGHO2_01_FULL_40_30]OHB19424.1 MAG: hypothetical protein A3D40_00660 [Parcubacteria group bacterium RIFCSPHIGHO2_02_FULL_40_12]OHB21123.1 MAG: hypothetical protein A2913_00820 [Parcubacteria group bacterium RIFCSPLOWO2_01_FULL_40_65]OHB23451.1 MAG: hypothetical protein A3I22_01480 [Parcubacteria group bacterium RIFCSPLOWO2_02_FULL_40_12]OHB23916.1 MAG: hypothetical protein A3F96_01685 [Parcubacteria group bacterium R
MSLIKKYAAVSAIAMLVLLPVFVLAQLPTVSPPTVPGTTLTEVENIVRRVAQFILIIGVIAALIYIVLGGIAWMRAGDDQTKIGEAKTKIWSGVWGALVVIAVGLILQTLAGVVTRVFFQ